MPLACLAATISLRLREALCQFNSLKKVWTYRVEVVEGINGHLPVDTGWKSDMLYATCQLTISNRDSVFEVFSTLVTALLSSLQVGLEPLRLGILNARKYNHSHDTDDTSLSLCNLLRDHGGDFGLVEVVFRRVSMRTIDHDGGMHIWVLCPHRSQDFLNVLGTENVRLTK